MTLRNQIIRLAHENPVLRPHLLQVLAGSGLTQFLTPVLEDTLFGDASFQYKVVKMDEGEHDATSYTDRWDYGRDQHITDMHGVSLTYKWPSQVLGLATFDVPGVPPNSSVQSVESIVQAYLSREGAAQFQRNIDDSGDLSDFLIEELGVRGGSITDALWKVTRATVQDVRVRFNKSTASVMVKVLLNIDINTDKADVESDEPDFDEDRYDRGRYGSLREKVIRLAHEHPEFRKELLPLVVK